jgi:hypothetical protein
VKKLTRYIPLKRGQASSSQADDASEVGKNEKPLNSGQMPVFMPYMYPYHHTMPSGQQVAVMMHPGYAIPNGAHGHGSWPDSWEHHSAPSNTGSGGAGPNTSSSNTNGYATHLSIPSSHMVPGPSYSQGHGNTYEMPRRMPSDASLPTAIATPAVSHTAAAAASYYTSSHVPEPFKPVQAAPSLPYSFGQGLGLHAVAATCAGGSSNGASVPHSGSSNNLQGHHGDYDLMMEFGMFDSMPELHGHPVGSYAYHAAGAHHAPQLSGPAHGAHQAYERAGHGCSDPTRGAGIPTSSNGHNTAQAAVHCPEQDSPSTSSHSTSSTSVKASPVPHAFDVACNTELTYDPIRDTFVRRADL